MTTKGGAVAKALKAQKEVQTLKEMMIMDTVLNAAFEKDMPREMLERKPDGFYLHAEAQLAFRAFRLGVAYAGNASHDYLHNLVRESSE
jgi:hypothetical protein